jgi:hypothetical protein
MDHKAAVKIAVEAMRLEMKGLAFDAHTHDRLGENNPTAVNASKRYKEIEQAIAVLTGQGKLL